MKPEDALEFRALRQEQECIHRLVRRMNDWIDRFAERQAGVPPLVVPSPPTPPPPPLAESMPTPVVLPVTAPKVEVELVAPLPLAGASELSSKPGAQPVESRATEPQSATPVREAWRSLEANDVAPKASVRASGDVAEPEMEESLEMTLGRVWLVRIGIVILLTGFVFLGNLAYQHIIPRLGAAGKLTLIGLAGSLLCGVGWQLEKRRESLRNYARVLLAGGCATIYYTAYAAHFVEPLRVIASPVIGGILLLMLAGGIGWTAHRRRSELLAMLAVLLSYYTSGINPVGGFTLFSSLLLTATAIFFLIRHRWTHLTFVSLAGTYVSYAWWRFFGDVTMVEHGDIFNQVAFLSGYWVLFTAGAFLTRRQELPEGARTILATANNGAFFGLAAHALAAGRPDLFWIFALGFGVVLLGLAALAARREPENQTMDGAYLVQGLIILTVGLTAKLTGYQLALMLAVQSVALLTGGKRHRDLRDGAGMLCAAGAGVLAWNGLMDGSSHAVATAGLVAFILAFDAWWWKRQQEVEAEFHPMAAVLVTAGLWLGVASAWQVAGGWPVLPWLGLSAVLFAALPLVLRFRELSMCGQAMLPAAAVAWVLSGETGNLTPASLLVAGVALVHWWPWQRKLMLNRSAREVLEASAALSAGLVALTWMVRLVDGPSLMAVSAVAAVVWIGASLLTRARMLAGVGLVFSILSVVRFVANRMDASWAIALVPSLGLAALALMTRWCGRLGGDVDVHAREIRKFLAGAAVALLMPWSFLHIPEEWLVLFFAAVASGCAVMSHRERSLAWASLGLGGLTVVLLVCRFGVSPTVQNLAAILLFPAACRWARSRSANETLQEAAPTVAWAIVGLLTVWCMRANTAYGWGVSLAVTWSLLALVLFGVGLLLRERPYRLGGLALLALGVGHVFFIDVWAVNALYRILSFLVLGIVLLVVGYFYNRFAEQLRRWL